MENNGWVRVTEDGSVGGLRENIPDTAEVTAQNANSDWIPFSYLDNIPDPKDPEDYRNLNHKPTINGVELNGNQTTETLGIKNQIDVAIQNAIETLELDTPKIYYETRATWDSMPQLIGKKNTIYVYIDYAKTADQKDVAGIKLGDGTSYLIDIPFLDEVYAEHIANQTIHVSASDRLNWDAKIRCLDEEIYDEDLIFTTVRIENT